MNGSVTSEVTAIKKICAIIDALNPSSKGRVLSYVCDWLASEQLTKDLEQLKSETSSSLGGKHD